MFIIFMTVITDIVLKLSFWQHKIDIREEAADETAKRILYTLSILKHRLPPDMTRSCFSSILCCNFSVLHESHLISSRMLDVSHVCMAQWAKPLIGQVHADRRWLWTDLD